MRVISMKCISPGVRGLIFLAIPAVLCGVCGCGISHSEKENDKLEHARPDHKPHSLPELVDQLRVRVDRFGEGKRSDRDLEQFEEIVNWIPEIAGETDLREKEWELATAISERLRTRFQKAVEKQDFDKKTTDELRDLIDLLQPLADLSRSEGSLSGVTS